MKKIVLSMIVAAAALVGCQKSEELTVSTGDKIQLTASASLPTEGRAIISKDENGVYRSRWAENEYLYLVEDCEGGSGSFLSQSMVRENEGETASFSFEVPALEASSYTYIATTAPVGIATRALFIDLADEQDQYYKGGSYDAAFDVLLSKAVVMDAQPATEGLRFSMQRLNGALKLSVKNLALATGEEVESITFACEQPIVGEVKVTFDDLAAGTYPIPFEVEAGKTAVKTSINNTTGNFEVFYSCLPATLKAGESYTVTVKTNKATYHKVATLPADMVIEPNEITSVTVNMGDAATKSKMENLSEEYEYAIGYTDVEGKVWLLPRTIRNRRPSAHQIGIAGTSYNQDAYDLTGVSINSRGSIEGEIPTLYRWKIKKTENEKYQFYYTTASTTVNLIGGNNASGLAIQSKNSEGSYPGQYTADGDYYDTFTVSEKEGGYTIQTEYNRYAHVTAAFEWRSVGVNDATGVVNFYRVNLASMKENEVIDQSTDLPAGTYAVLYKRTDGEYYALPNETNISGEAGSYTIAHPATGTIADAGITLNEDGTVASADVPNRFKWVITKRGTTTAYDFRSAVNMTHFLYMRSSSTIAIGPNAIVKAVHDKYQPDWHLTYSSANGIQGQVTGSTRYLYCDSTVWAAANNTNYGSLVFVYLSPSTKQIAENE